LRGFVDAFARSGLPVPEDLIRARSLSADFGLRETNLLLSQPAPPTAIIAAGNRLLVGVLKVVQQRGLRIPQDLSLITCDQTDLALLYPGPVTLIDRDIRDIGRTAAQLLLERLHQGAGGPAQRVTMPTRLILGGSCGPPSG
jgi:LacI family transcriptional regulator